REIDLAQDVPGLAAISLAVGGDTLLKRCHDVLLRLALEASIRRRAGLVHPLNESAGLKRQKACPLFGQIRNDRLRIDVNEIAQQRVDLVVPLLAAEHAVVSDAGLHVVDTAIGANAGTELLRGERLADRADVILFAFDRHQPHAPDRSRVYGTAAEGELAEWQQMVLEHVADGLDVEFGRKIHDSEIFIIERLDDCSLLVLAFHQVIVQVYVLLDVALEIHRDEGGELHEARIDFPERALALQRYVVDQVTFEPFERLALGELVDLGRLDARVDRARHQRQRRRTRGMIVLAHDRRRSERGYRRLTDRHHVRARP